MSRGSHKKEDKYKKHIEIDLNEYSGIKRVLLNLVVGLLITAVFIIAILLLILSITFVLIPGIILTAIATFIHNIKIKLKKAR